MVMSEAGDGYLGPIRPFTAQYYGPDVVNKGIRES